MRGYMKKKLCPYCNNKIDNEIICPYCFENIEDVSSFDQKRRMLLVASRVNDEKLILKASSDLLALDNNNLLGNYFYAYALMKSNNKEVMDKFFQNDYLGSLEDTKEVIYHLIRYKHLYKIEDIKNFIAKVVTEGTKIKHYYELLEDNDEEDIDIRELPLVDLPIIPVRNKVKPLAIFLIIVGTVMMIILSLIVKKIFNETNIIFSTILLFVFPCLLVGMGLTRLILKKGNVFITFLLMFFILVFSTYILLFSYIRTFVEHVENVITSPYDLIMYFIRKVFLNI